MIFRSILFSNNSESITKDAIDMPECFKDLNLDQIINAVTAKKEQYNLKPYFYSPLSSIDDILFRQEVFKDLENESLFNNIKLFAEAMRSIYRHLAMVEKLDDDYHKEGWFLETVKLYCDTITGLVYNLNSADLKSSGLITFRDYVIHYVESDYFKSLLFTTDEIKTELSKVKYSLIIKGYNVKVRKYDSEIDYSKEIEKTFEKFEQCEVKDYRVNISTGIGMNHIEARILSLVVKLYPSIFKKLIIYYSQNRDFPDQTITDFDREIQFYISYLDYIEPVKKGELKFCYPEISDSSKSIYNYDGYDLALAHKFIKENLNIVLNDFYMKNDERVFVVTGPNQGGKTTFARTFGQLHYLASIGCPVPGRESKLFLFDRLFTHFEKEENIKELRGKLEDDLIRIHHIKQQSTSNSIIIMNEIFTSTTLKDTIFLNRKIMEIITDLDLICVVVTFIDELSYYNSKTVSMVSTVDSENPAFRTYKIVRKPADGLAYAISIAEKYRLTYNCLKERIKS